MKKQPLFVYLLLTTIFLGFFNAQEAQAATIWGWAWSENIGWVSMNRQNTGVNNWEVLDEGGNGNSETDYIWSDSSCWQRDFYNIQDPPAGLPEDIQTVKIKTQRNSTVWVFAKKNTSIIEPTQIGVLPGVWMNSSYDLTGNWTWNDVKKVQVGVALKGKLVGSVFYPGKLSQVYIEVTRSGGQVLILRPNGPGDYTGVPNRMPISNPSINYGVEIESNNGNIKGYALTEHTGWIDFNPSGPYPSEPSYSACVNLPGVSGEVCSELAEGDVGGWARIVTGNSYQPWIKLRGPEYGLRLVDSFGPTLSAPCCGKEFLGWAWSDEIGWISFNDKNCDPDGDHFSNGAGNCPAVGTVMANYEVTSDFSIPPNSIPSAEDLDAEEDDDRCFKPNPPIYLSWTFTDPDAGDTQELYQIQVDDNSSFASPEIDSGTVDSSSNTYTPWGLSFGTQYWWRLKVWDSNGGSSDWISGPSFTTDQRWPNPQFVWSPESPIMGDEVSFENNTTNCDPCGYTWDFGDGSEAFNIENPAHVFSSNGISVVSLTANNAGRSCTKTQDLNVKMRLPKWKEISPAW